jgi:ketosteroid isomerase-like protein
VIVGERLETGRTPIVEEGQEVTGISRGAGLSIMLAAMLAASSAAADEHGDVLAANAQFYAALNDMFKGDLAPMKTVWSHADDVTYMGPTGNFEHGWAAVLKDWEGQAAMKLGGQVEPADIQVTLGDKMAVVSDFEMGENNNAQGNVEHLKLRATNVYRKEGVQWKMVGHHTDPLPYLAK